MGICLGERMCQNTCGLTGAPYPGVPALGASFEQVPIGLAHPPSVAINTVPSLVKEKTHSPKVRPFLDKKMSNIHQVLPPELEGSEPGDKSAKSLSESRWGRFYWSAGETVALSARKVAKSILSSKYYQV